MNPVFRRRHPHPVFKHSWHGVPTAISSPDGPLTGKREGKWDRGRIPRQPVSQKQPDHPMMHDSDPNAQPLRSQRPHQGRTAAWPRKRAPPSPLTVLSSPGPNKATPSSSKQLRRRGHKAILSPDTLPDSCSRQNPSLLQKLPLEPLYATRSAHHGIPRGGTHAREHLGLQDLATQAELGRLPEYG